MAVAEYNTTDTAPLTNANSPDICTSVNRESPHGDGGVRPGRICLTRILARILTRDGACLTVMPMQGGEQLSGDVLFQTPGGLVESGLLYVSIAYAVLDQKVLLVLHNRFHKWVPPGGHVDPGETFSAAARREFHEETGIECRLLSASPPIHPADGNSTPEPTPFYADVLREGFRKPAQAFYYYVEPLTWPTQFDSYQRQELDGIGTFTLPEVRDISTFEQVRSVAAHAITYHPGSAS
jgi:8-oxo-dGTP diphosphatase